MGKSFISDVFFMALFLCSPLSFVLLLLSPKRLQNSPEASYAPDAEIAPRILLTELVRIKQEYTDDNKQEDFEEIVDDLRTVQYSASTVAEAAGSKDISKLVVDLLAGLCRVLSGIKEEATVREALCQLSTLLAGTCRKSGGMFGALTGDGSKSGDSNDFRP